MYSVDTLFLICSFSPHSSVHHVLCIYLFVCSFPCLFIFCFLVFLPLHSSPTLSSSFHLLYSPPPLVSIFSGVVGDSNTLCHNSTSPIIGLTGAIGSTCTTGTNCLYGLCLNGVCTAPALTCPTNTTGVFTTDFNRIHVIISEVFG